MANETDRQRLLSLLEELLDEHIPKEQAYQDAMSAQAVRLINKDVDEVLDLPWQKTRFEAACLALSDEFGIGCDSTDEEHELYDAPVTEDFIRQYLHRRRHSMNAPEPRRDHESLPMHRELARIDHAKAIAVIHDRLKRDFPDEEVPECIRSQTSAKVASLQDAAAGYRHGPPGDERQTTRSVNAKKLANPTVSRCDDGEEDQVAQPRKKPGAAGPTREKIETWQSLKLDWLRYRVHCKTVGKRPMRDADWQKWCCEKGVSSDEFTPKEAKEELDKFIQHLRRHPEDDVSLGNSNDDV